MEKILGLDLGTNSIGWAIREVNAELENQIIDKGVLTFEKGVAEDKSGEHPKVQKRTDSRGKRRNYQAEKYRKWELLECLIENKMCPLSIEELNEWRHYKKGIGRKYPQAEKFIQWLRFDFDGDGKPDFERLGYDNHESYYLFRNLIIDESKKEIFQNEPYITGRILYQLVQRRGYFDLTDLEEKEKNELSKTIMKGGGDSGAIGVEEITPYLKKYQTLGAALYQLQKEKKVRIRKRYNLRSHFENELKEICKVQQLEHLYNRFWSAIIWQRPLRRQKGLVGICIYERNKPRCPISHPLYEEYRTWVFINNLKIRPIKQVEDEAKTKQELERILNEVVYPLFYRASDFKISIIEKELKKHGYKITAKFPEDTKAITCLFLYQMQQIFYEEWTEQLGWKELLNNEPKPINCKYNIEDLWHWHFTKTSNKKTGQESFEIIKDFAVKKLSLPEDKAERFAKIRLQQGYATLSANAIKKILPYLKKGFIYSEAIYLANLPKVLGKKKLMDGDIENFSKIIREKIKQHRYEQKIIGVYNNLVTDYFEDKNSFEQNKAQLIEDYLKESYGEKTWNNFSAETISNIISDVEIKLNTFLHLPKQKPENHYAELGRLHDKIFVELMNEYGLPPENIKRLWHPSEQETYPPAPEKNGKKYLGNPEPISPGFKNPMALKTLHHLKKLLNYLIEVGKIHEQTRIVVETARKLNNANVRKAIERWQRDRERENDVFRKKLEEINVECNTNYDVNDKNLIDKIRLWEEQKRICIYTGKTINLCDLLDGSKFDYEHTIPASMSFDNELKNLTIADKLYNQQIKGKKLPTECPNFESSYTYNKITYPPIIDTLQMIFGKIEKEEKIIKGKRVVVYRCEKIEELEKQYQEWKDKTSEDKEIKDNIIIRRHYLKMQLDYWRSKFRSFTITEYKAGWRNSQLRDTQTITKYAIPYLKTVFENVESQKGNITSDFRKIFNIQPKKEKKDRSTHAHHAIDAAVLTLIPPAVVRDKFLKEYNEAIDTGMEHHYHRKPPRWNNFRAHHILEIEEDVLINFQPEFRTLTPTYKNVRKRGKLQLVKYKDESGRWQYKLDANGDKIPLVAKGDSIRGQLHKESFFGAIKKNNDLILVERHPIASFTSINDCKHIVDDTLRELVQNVLEQRMAEGLSFDKAKLEPIPFPNGKEVIKKVRCKVAAGRGYLTPEKALEIRRHTYLSKYNYKQSVYAQNEENTLCLYYELQTGNKTEKAFRIVGLFELAQLNLNNLSDIKNDNALNKVNLGKGKNIRELQLAEILKVGTKVIFYNQHIEELKDLPYQQLLKRVFRVYKFNEMGTPNLFLQNHLEARKNELMDDGDTNFNSSKYQYRLKIKADKFTCAIEDKHFKIKPDGQINWKF